MFACSSTTRDPYFRLGSHDFQSDFTKISATRSANEPQVASLKLSRAFVRAKQGIDLGGFGNSAGLL